MTQTQGNRTENMAKLWLTRSSPPLRNGAARSRPYAWHHGIFGGGVTLYRGWRVGRAGANTYAEDQVFGRNKDITIWAESETRSNCSPRDNHIPRARCFSRDLVFLGRTGARLTNRGDKKVAPCCTAKQVFYRTCTSIASERRAGERASERAGARRRRL